MRTPFRKGTQALLEELIALIRSSSVDGNGELTRQASLIKSGQLDSLTLFNLAIFVEREIGHPVDVTAFDLANEWDTLDDILSFISNERTSR